MNSDPRDSGTGSKYQAVIGDDTRPHGQESGSTFLPDYLVAKFDKNIDAIKEDVGDIKHKITVDQSMIIADISIGIVSSLIVSILFLFITTNIGIEVIHVFGMSLPILVLFVVSLGFVAFATHWITKRDILRNQKIKKTKNKK